MTEDEATTDRLPHLGRHVFTDSSYDEAGDVLYLSIGHPREAFTWESPEGLLMRLDPETLEVVGLTVMHVAARKAQGLIAVTLPAVDEMCSLTASTCAEELELPGGFLVTCR